MRGLVFDWNIESSFVQIKMIFVLTSDQLYQMTNTVVKLLMHNKTSHNISLKSTQSVPLSTQDNVLEFNIIQYKNVTMHIMDQRN